MLFCEAARDGIAQCGQKARRDGCVLPRSAGIGVGRAVKTGLVAGQKCDADKAYEQACNSPMV